MNVKERAWIKRQQEKSNTLEKKPILRIRNRPKNLSMLLNQRCNSFSTTFSAFNFQGKQKIVRVCGAGWF